MRWELTATFILVYSPTKTGFRPVISVRSIDNLGEVTDRYCYIPMIVDKKSEAREIAEERLNKIMNVMITRKL